MANYKKVFVVDTSVLIDSPKSVKELLNGNNLVIVPWQVHKELEYLESTRDRGSKARNALLYISQVISSKNNRLIFMQSDWGNIDEYFPSGILNKSVPDDNILVTALNAHRQYRDNVNQIIFLTHGVAKSIKANELMFNGGKCLLVEEWRKDKGQSLADLQMPVINLPIEVIKSKQYKGYLPLDVIRQFFEKEIFDNMGFLVKSVNGGDSYISHAAIFRNSHLVLLPQDQKLCQNIGQQSLNINGKISVNWDQVLAINSLLDLNVNYFSLIGEAGTGKTFLAIASALHFLQKSQRKFKRIYITRAPIPVGESVGFIPGTLEEKMEHWTHGMIDNISVIKKLNISLTKQIDTWLGTKDEKEAKNFDRKCRIKILGLEHIRGRSIDDSVIIVDEFQNVDSGQAKTFATRLGKNSRMIFTGDPTQIDNKYLNEQRNGLIWLTSVMKGDPHFSHIYFTKSVRSQAVQAFLKRLKIYESKNKF